MVWHPNEDEKSNIRLYVSTLSCAQASVHLVPSLHLSVHESAYMFVHFVNQNDVFVSVSGTHCLIWSGWVFVDSERVGVDLKVSVSAWQKDRLYTVPVWSQDSTGNRRFLKTPGTCFLYKCLKKKQTPEKAVGDFSLLASMTSNRGLWTSSPYRSDTLRKRERYYMGTRNCLQWRKDWTSALQSHCSLKEQILFQLKLISSASHADFHLIWLLTLTWQGGGVSLTPWCMPQSQQKLSSWNIIIIMNSVFGPQRSSHTSNTVQKMVGKLLAIGTDHRKLLCLAVVLYWWNNDCLKLSKQWIVFLCLKWEWIIFKSTSARF